jgi:hypothetical protein
MLTRYPGYGEGFKVSHSDWPENTFYHIRSVKLFVITQDHLISIIL